MNAGAAHIYLTVDLCSNTPSEEIAQILLVEVVLMERESTTRPQIAVRAVVDLEGKPEPNAKVFGTADLKRACCLRPHATRTGPPCGTLPAGGQLLAAGRGRRIARGCSRLLNPPRGAAVGTQESGGTKVSRPGGVGAARHVHNDDAG
jgi:hypothetical protein